MASFHQLPADLKALALQAVQTQAAGLVEKLMDDLVKAGIAHRARVPCTKLVVARCNRGGYGINAFDVQDNTSDIASTHWYDKLFKGVCTEIEADEFDDVIAFNSEQVAAANGVLAPVEPFKAIYQTLCGGHTTQGMKAVAAGCLHWDEELCIDGHLSMTMVEQKSPSYAEAIRSGAEYTIVPYWVLKQHPGLDNAIQAAGNVHQNIAKAINDAQMLQRVHAMIHQKSSFEQVKLEFKKTRPKNLEALPGMYNFIRKFPDSNMVQGLIKYVKAANVNRKVCDAAYDALQGDYKGIDQASIIRFGVLAALYVDDKADLLNATAIKGFGGDKKLQGTIECNKILKDFYDKIHAHDELKNDHKAMLCWFNLCADVAAHRGDKHTSSVIKHLRDMKKPTDYDITVNHLQQMCVQRIFAETGITLTDEWSKYAIVDASKPKPPKVGQTEKQQCVRSCGDITIQMMLEMGFRTGDQVTLVKKESKTAPTTVYTIVSMVNGKITLEMGASIPGVEADLVEFQGKKWKHYTATTPKECEWHTYVEAYSNHWSKGMVESFIKATAMVAVHKSWDEETLESNGLSLSLQPKAVCANDKYSAGALVLSPNSQSVAVREIAENAQTVVYGSGGIFLGITSIGGKPHGVFAASVSPSLKKEESKNARDTLMIPYWMLETTDKDETANMKFTCDPSKLVIDSQEPEVKVPLIKNSKVLKPGDKLVLFVPAALSLHPVPALKKQKTIKK